MEKFDNLIARPPLHIHIIYIHFKPASHFLRSPQQYICDCKSSIVHELILLDESIGSTHPLLLM